MKIEFLSLDEYLKLYLKPSNIFGQKDFLRLNASKADNIVCAIGDRRVGIVFGEVNGVLHSPWSAPYASLGLSDDSSINDVKDFGFQLRNALKPTQRIRLMTPPEVYNDPATYFFKEFIRPADSIVKLDTFYFPLSSSLDETDWARDTKRNLRLSKRNDLQFIPINDLESCYSLIARHHSSHGYDMAMTFEQLKDTGNVFPIDLWGIKYGDTLISAAYCYRVADNVVQIINTGDTPMGRKMYAITYMIRCLIDYYRELMVDKQNIADAILDYGPADSLDSVNEGLRRFKLAIGCQTSPKLIL